MGGKTHQQLKAPTTKNPAPNHAAAWKPSKKACEIAARIVRSASGPKLSPV